MHAKIQPTKKQIHSNIYVYLPKLMQLRFIQYGDFLQRHALTGSPHRKTKTRNLQIRTGTSSNPPPPPPPPPPPATKAERIPLKYPVNKRMLVIQTGKFGPCIYHIAETLFLSTICSTLIHHRTLYIIQSSYVLKKM